MSIFSSEHVVFRVGGAPRNQLCCTSCIQRVYVCEFNVSFIIISRSRNANPPHSYADKHLRMCSMIYILSLNLTMTLGVLLFLSMLRNDAGRLVLGPLRRMLKIVAFCEFIAKGGNNLCSFLMQSHKDLFSCILIRCEKSTFATTATRICKLFNVET
jgi:hypothetical protein